MMNMDENQNNCQFDKWKQNALSSFTRWLNELTPDTIEDSKAPEDLPDLFTFFSSLNILQTETRKLSRKTAESLSGFGEVLNKVEAQFSQMETSGQSVSMIQIIGLFDRIIRIQSELKKSPSPKKLFNDMRWVKYHATISEAINLLSANLNDITKKMGLVRVAAAGELFDPSFMVAVEVEHTTSFPDNQVVEVINAGYMHEGNVVRLAEVKVARNM
jgi:molecular chaperone GrpE (heat shock protein)